MRLPTTISLVLIDTISPPAAAVNTAAQAQQLRRGAAGTRGGTKTHVLVRGAYAHGPRLAAADAQYHRRGYAPYPPPGGFVAYATGGRQA